MYDALVSYRAPVAFYADLIRQDGEPALEIGCGAGHPLLALLEQGLDVHGLDSSRDMLARCEAKAEARGLRVTLHQQEMQSFALVMRYRTIFFAGASFMLLPDARDAERTLERIHHHLQPGGQVVIPLYVPPRMPEAQNATDQWSTRERIRPSDGAILRLSERYRYDWPRQLRVATLRYEVISKGAVVQAVERPWLLRWYSQAEFRRLLREAGFPRRRRCRGTRYACGRRRAGIHLHRSSAVRIGRRLTCQESGRRHRVESVPRGCTVDRRLEPREDLPDAGPRAGARARRRLARHRGR
jgi:SAM-dependent methyltransferase